VYSVVYGRTDGSEVRQYRSILTITLTSLKVCVIIQNSLGNRCKIQFYSNVYEHVTFKLGGILCSDLSAGDLVL